MRHKMGGWFCAVAAAAVMLLPAERAIAQEDAGNIRAVPDRLKVGLGGFLGPDPDTDTDDRQGWFLLTASYDLLRPSASRFVDFAAYFETAGTQRRERRNLGRFRDTSRSANGVGVAMTVRLLPTNPHLGIYAMAGGGIYSLRREVGDVYEYTDFNAFGEDTLEEYTDRLETRTRFTPGFKLGGGVRFGRGVFVEAAYYNFGRLDDTDYSGVGVTVGMRL